MNKYLISFLHRGLIFGGFGPIILGLVFLLIELSGIELALSGKEICLAIISTYFIAFIQAGASIFNQIEHWPLAKSLFFHFFSLFAVYSLAYFINSWIPFEPLVILSFSAIFVLVYFAVWFTVYFSVKAYTKKLNNSLK